MVIACAVGCAHRHERVEVVGLVVPVVAPAPPAGEVREPLPPMPDMRVAPDTRDGSILVAVDRREFWLRNGRDFPAWSPPPASARDAMYDRLRALREQLAAVRAALAALPAVDDAGRPLLPSDEFSALTARVLALGQRLEAYLAAERDAGAPGVAPASPLDGDAAARRLAEASWRGMDAAIAAAVAAAAAVREAAAAETSDATPTTRAAAATTAAVDALAAAARAREPTAVLPRLRVACAALADLAGDAAVVRALAGAGPPAARLGDALADARRALTAVAARWLANRAAEIDPQPRPTLVYERPDTLDGGATAVASPR